MLNFTERKGERTKCIDIEITRGDYLPLTVNGTDKVTGGAYSFKVGEVIRFKIFDKKDVENVLLSKDFKVESESESVDIEILADEMKIGENLSKKVDYAYEIELNPDTPYTNTITGHTKELGFPILTLLAEGGNKND